MNRPNRGSILSGPKARYIAAWAGASWTSAGPGKPALKIQGLKGRNKIRIAHVPPLQGGGMRLGTFTWGFTPGCHIAGPSALDRLGAEPNEVVVLDAVGTISTSPTFGSGMSRILAHSISSRSVSIADQGRG